MQQRSRQTTPSKGDQLSQQLRPASAEESDIVLSPLEFSVLDFFTECAKRLSIPGTAGAVFGLLFVARTPLHMNQIKKALGISLGSTSQGLKLLRSMGIVRMVYTSGKRRDHYSAEIDIHLLLGCLFRTSIRPRLSSGAEWILKGLKTSEEDGVPEFLQDRLRTLLRWHEVVSELVTFWDGQGRRQNPHPTGNPN
jgi:HTH-type transcriptional regulator, glycine betaine synthesis regulator